ncbi:MAG: hypothetical protein WA943_04580 [Parvibaculum sp.]|uniref:hypothetical protein n=1 Tax=Parvibaculum sp. TaxID=2024848 RepID=UPI003C73842B
MQIDHIGALGGDVRLGGGGVVAVHVDMAAAHRVARQNLDATGRRDAAQFDPPKARNSGVVEDRALAH